ncbi:hypothetical protein KIN20_011534 [Parelaphostrongylus tenuis]|uniref:Uncharacterized protein n=1 Tax=Parelaphostrongylus tenuis TaxID=148309 RepID=A0AAD5QL25_PARTN|nr:hypothetical protein KIN20_011534 [Parelaphostrongylus tenuis]
MRLWIASLIFYVFVFAVCEVLRFIIARVLPKRLSADLLLEFVGTLQICTPMFDVNTVLDTYGLFGVFVEITVIELANCYFLRDAFANPCPIAESILLHSFAEFSTLVVFDRRMTFYNIAVGQNEPFYHVPLMSKNWH